MTSVIGPMMDMRLSNPYENVKAAQAANGGAYPPDMSVLVKARGGGVDYIYSLLQGYEDAPNGITLDDGVYYNKYMYGNKIKMAAPLSDDLIEYGDGTKATVEQMSKDVTTFLMWGRSGLACSSTVFSSAGGSPMIGFFDVLDGL